MNREVLYNLLWFAVYLVLLATEIIIIYIIKTPIGGVLGIVIAAYFAYLMHKYLNKTVECWDSHLADKINFEQRR